MELIGLNDKQKAAVKVSEGGSVEEECMITY